MRIIEDTRKVKTRKDHMCFACCHSFPKGTEMYRQVNVYDGDIGSVYHCETCEEIMTKYKDFMFDSVEGVFPEGCVRDLPSNIFSFDTLEKLQVRGKKLSAEEILEIIKREYS